MSMKKTLVLGFMTEEGKSLRLTINAPKEDLEGPAVGNVMDQIIATNALGGASKVATKGSAQYVVQEVEELDFA